MATNAATGSIELEEFARILRAALLRIDSLRALVNAQGQAALDLPGLRQGLNELEQMVGELLYALQEAGGELSLAALPDISLTESLSQLVESTAETLGLSSRVLFTGHERPLSDYLSRLLYRIARETLARVSSHAGARRLRFTLDYQRTEILMSIEDDGVRADPEQSSTAEMSFPFLGAQQQGDEPVFDQLMRRLRAMVGSLGGSLEMHSGVEQGVQVQVRVPLRSPEQSGPPPAPNREAVKGSARITVLIVDSQAVSRAGLRRLLESYPDLEVVGEAGDSVQAVSETAELLPQMVLIDAQLPENGAVETLRQLRQLNAETRALLLAAQEDEALLYEALRAGAGGYVSKEVAPDELARSVRAVARGEVLLQPQLAARLLTRFGGQEQSMTGGSPQESLTAREREVLQLLARGLRNKEIAARLVVSERTVNFHLANIYAKLHVSGRTEALSKALEQGLLRV